MVGRNGAGKSSTLRVLSGIVPLNSGRVACGGQIVAQLELGAGFGRDFSGRENIFLNGALHGLSKEQIEERLDAIIAFSELGDFIDAPVATYSSGMFLRLGFSIAAHLDADVLLIDEVLAVGDEAFQRKCEARIAEQIADGATLVLVSHDPRSSSARAGGVIVLDGGEKIFDGPVGEGMPFYHRLMGTADAAVVAMKPEEALAGGARGGGQARRRAAAPGWRSSRPSASRSSSSWSGRRSSPTSSSWSRRASSARRSRGSSASSSTSCASTSASCSPSRRASTSTS